MGCVWRSQTQVSIDKLQKSLSVKLEMGQHHDVASSPSADSDVVGAQLALGAPEAMLPFDSEALYNEPADEDMVHGQTKGTDIGAPKSDLRSLQLGAGENDEGDEVEVDLSSNSEGRSVADDSDELHPDRWVGDKYTSFHGLDEPKTPGNCAQNHDAGAV